MNYYKNISIDIFVSKDNGTHSKKNDSYAKCQMPDDGGRNVFQRDKCTLTGSCG